MSELDRRARAGIDLYGSHPEDALNRLHTRVDRHFAPPRPVWTRRGFLAVALVVMLFGLWQLMRPLDRSEREALMAASLQPLPTSALKAPRDSTLRLALKAYAAQDFVLANEAFRTYLANHPREPILWLYYGHSLYTLEQDDALEVLQLASDLNREPSLYRHARYYLAMAHYRRSEFRQARPVLEELAETDGHFRDQARWLLQLAEFRPWAL